MDKRVQPDETEDLTVHFRRDAPDGGRGIWLIRKMSRSMQYDRVDGCNRLEIHIDGQPADKDARPDRASSLESVK